MNHRFLAPITLSLALANLVTSRPAGAAAQSAGAASPPPVVPAKTYTNRTAHYSFAYPATWKVNLRRDISTFNSQKIQAFNITVYSPGNNDEGFGALGFKGALCVARIRLCLDQVLSIGAPPRSKIAYRTTLISGVSFQTGRYRGKGRNDGIPVDATAYAAIYRGITYLFLSAYVLNNAATATQRAQVLAVVRSVRIA